MVLIIVLQYFKNHKMEFDCFLEFDVISTVGVKRLVTRRALRAGCLLVMRGDRPFCWEIIFKT